MKGISFVAATAEEALAQVQERMGEQALVLDIRRVRARGLTRLWRKPQVEVVACAPEGGTAPSTLQPDPSAVAEQPAGSPPDAAFPHEFPPYHAPEAGSQPGQGGDGHSAVTMDALMVAKELSRWPSLGLLAKAGFTPLALQRIAELLDRENLGEETSSGQMGGRASGPRELAGELAMVRRILGRFWKVPAEVQWDRPQVLMGPLGSGKTTALSKWLAQLALGEGRNARVIRLDGATANTSRLLDLHAEMLGVPVVRSRAEAVVVVSGEVCLVDVPGVDWREPGAMGELRRALDKISGYEGHLVLNGAYEIGVLLAQVRAFEGFPIRSLWITHLDEESRWSKLWNLAVLTSLPIRHGSAGQNVPGDLWVATEEMLGKGLWPATRP